jgi:uncharacterized protein YqeY
MYDKLQFVASEPGKHDKLKFVEHLRARLKMSLKEQIGGDMVTAMKAKDAARTSTLRMLKSAISYREIEKGGPLDDEELSKLLRSQLKQRRDSVEQYEKGGRQDLAEKETAEIAIIETYLPQAASPEEIEQAVSQAIAQTGASSMKEMGGVMKATMVILSGKNPDGRVVSDTVKKKLSAAS